MQGENTGRRKGHTPTVFRDRACCTVLGLSEWGGKVVKDRRGGVARIDGNDLVLRDVWGYVEYESLPWLCA